MAICKYVKIEKTKLCTNDKKTIVSLIKREIFPPPLGEVDTLTVFTTLISPWTAIKTIKPSRRFDNINIEDMPTHEVLMDFDSTIWPLDSDNVFIRLDDGRRLRIVGATDLNELKTTISILCTERGIEDLAGSEA